MHVPSYLASNTWGHVTSTPYHMAGYGALGAAAVGGAGYGAYRMLDRAGMLDDLLGRKKHSSRKSKSGSKSRVHQTAMSKRRSRRSKLRASVTGGKSKRKAKRSTTLKRRSSRRSSRR